MALRVLLVDDQPFVRQQLRQLMERDGFDVVGEAQDRDEVHRLAAELGADVVVLGLRRPLDDFLSVAADIRRTTPRAGVIVTTFEDHLVLRAFQVGVRGYVLKTRAAEELPPAIRAVADGKTYVSPGISLPVSAARATADDQLTAET